MRLSSDLPYATRRLSREVQYTTLKKWKILTFVGCLSYTVKAHEFIRSYLREVINEFLSAAVSDVDAFLKVMAEADAVLVGARVVALLDPLFDAEDSPWTMCVSCQGYGVLKAWLLEKQGGFEEVEERFEEVRAGVRCKLRVRTHMAVFEILCSATSTSLCVVAHFPSTILFNYVSHRDICVSYPRLLDERRGLIVQRDLGGEERASLRQFSQSGIRLSNSTFSIWKKPDSGCLADGDCPHASRFFGDDWCLMFDFLAPHTVHCAKPFGTRHLYEPSAGWVWGGKGCGGLACTGSVPFCCHDLRLVIPV